MAKKNGKWDKIIKALPFPLDTTGWITKNLPFIFYFAFLCFIYIANARYSERKVRTIQGLQKDIQRLSWEYLSLKSELMLKTMQSEVTEESEKRKLGLRELQVYPKKITVKKEKRY
jgi:hypothetical protein